MKATLTSKGQVTLPKALRDRLQLHEGDKVEFIVDEAGRVELRAVTASVKKLKGMLPSPKRSLSLEEMDEAIARGVAES